MIGRSAFVLVGLALATGTAEAQGPRLSDLAVLQAPERSATQPSGPVLSSTQRRAMSKGTRTALWGGIGAVAGFLIANVATDEDGIKSAELVGALAGAATGAVVGLVVIPAFWPSGS